MQTTGDVGLRPIDSRRSARPRSTCRCLRGCSCRGGCRSAPIAPRRSKRLHRARHREAFGEHDACRRTGSAPRIAAARRVRHVEQRRRARRRTATARSRSRLRPAASPVDRAIAGGRASNRLLRRRRSTRAAPTCPAATDVELGRVQRDRHAQRLQPLDDVVAGGLFVGRAGLANERDEAIQQRARFIEPDSTRAPRLRAPRP